MFNGAQQIWGASSRPMSEGPNTPTAHRVRQLRLVLGYNVAADFARDVLGISPSRWNNFERGYRLSNEIVDLLVERVPGLTSDWLRYGKPDGLPVSLYRQLTGPLPPGGPPQPLRKARMRSS